MWNQFLNQSTSQNKFQNTPLIILGNKHSGKRSLVDSLFDISKTTVHNKRLATHNDTNKMRLKGLATAIDYAYLNVLDITDIDYRTHAKLQVYMVQESENPIIFDQLAKQKLLRKAVVIIMLDFTNPWNFLSELNKWIKFLKELQQRAKIGINQLDEMALKIQRMFKIFKTPEFDQNGKLKKKFQFQKDEKQVIQIPLPTGVLKDNIRVPLIICVNKCDLQSQVLRDESAQKILIAQYHLRKFCVQYGASLIYTSIKNNSNLNLLYQYTLSLAYDFPFKYKPESSNQEAIFIPLGYDNPKLIQDSVININIEKPYEQLISAPPVKKQHKQQVMVEQQSKYFQKYANLTASSISTSVNQNSSVSGASSKQGSEDTRRNQATIFFKNLLITGSKKQTGQKNIKASQAEKCLQKHTNMVIKKKQ